MLTTGIRGRRRINPASAVAMMIIVLLAGSARAAITYTDLYTLGTPSGFDFAGPAGFNPIAGGQVVGYGSGTGTGGNNHAVLWTPAVPGGTDLNPAGFTSSRMSGTSGAQQVGEGQTSSQNHALLWSGTTASAVDLNPAGFDDSRAEGVGGTQQVGFGTPTSGTLAHALLWTGTSASAVDLNPAGFIVSRSLDTSGTQQVGSASASPTGDNEHAMLWSGTAASAVDLNPAGFDVSLASGVRNTQQVGSGSGSASSFNTHALLWTGSAASAIDLNPAGFVISEAYGTSGTFQVGVGYHTIAGSAHALLWGGSASVFSDLQSVLPPSFTDSIAYSINGSTVYGEAIDTDGNTHAIVWSLPEPGSACIILAGGCTALLRRPQRGWRGHREMRDSHLS